MMRVMRRSLHITHGTLMHSLINLVALVVVTYMGRGVAMTAHMP